MIKVSKPQTGFSLIPNSIIQNEDLSAVARCLWSYLASLPEDWRPRAPQLQRALGIGRDRLQKACAELERAGALIRSTNRCPKTGQVFGYVWQLLAPDRVPEKPAAGSPGSRFTRQPDIQAPYRDTSKKDTKGKKKESESARAQYEISSKKGGKARTYVDEWLPPQEDFDNAAILLFGDAELTSLLRLDPIFDAFCDYARDKGRASSDWSAAWRTWVSREKQYIERAKISA